MSRYKKIIVILIFLILFLFFALLLIRLFRSFREVIPSPSYLKKPEPSVTIVEKTISPTPLTEEIFDVSPTPAPISEPIIKSVFYDVPFTSQAPFSEWSDPRQQDACEEAASLMAARFAKNQTQTLSKIEARLEILEIAKYQQDKYGDSRDTSASDTLDRILKGYYNLNHVSIREINSIDEIIFSLMEGNIVILPMNGQLLNNPHFTQPGPERHMVVVRGYDIDTNEFITNDPGVWQGEKYRYPVQVFFNAIRDYRTGYHLPFGELKKTMIVVGKN